MQNYNDLTFFELVGPKINTVTGEKVYSGDNSLALNEKWMDPSGLLLPDSEVIFYSACIFLLKKKCILNFF
jgi:CRP-like cAMP-binding protein